MPHFLKRLELNGFKSFAVRTVLEFPPGITAVVGPNGSGKSNIVDAVRWLLGEREAKNLRGARVDDLIFAGTAKRPRLGQAQASLYFENKNKFFPVDFAEVAVTRQVARDGTSRYFLNKSEVLLRDLIDFFAKARLGSRGLVVMTQGNSDVFVRADAKERREMIEEILGLREYQIKKADSERRLKNSQINLDKACALIEEILPHLRSLKRQTNKWEKRGALEEELVDLENKFFGSHIYGLKRKNVDLDKKLDLEYKKQIVLEKEKREAEEKQKRLELSQPEGRKDISRIRETVQSLVLKRGALEKEIARLEARIELERERPQSADYNIKQVLDFVKKIKVFLGECLSRPADEIKSAVESAVSEMNDFLGEGMGKAKAEMPQDLKEQLQKLTSEVSELNGKIKELGEEEQKLEKSQESFYEDFKRGVAAVEAVKDRLEGWHVANRELMFEKERLRLRREELEHQVISLGRHIKEFEDFGGKESLSAEELSQIEKRIFKLRGDLAAIGEVDEALMKEAKNTGSRYEFLKKESKDLESAVADLRELISELGDKIKTEFSGALVKINEEFNKFFGLMFGGGRAKLKVQERQVTSDKSKGEAVGATGEVTDESKVADEEESEEKEESGVEIDLRLPRKKIHTLDALSGGERSLVGIAVLFALISVSPPPFLVLDEIDAALDDRNSQRFADMLKEFSRQTQFVVITHNRATMEVANVLYGVTLNDDGTSKVLSLKLEKVK